MLAVSVIVRRKQIDPYTDIQRPLSIRRVYKETNCFFFNMTTQLAGTLSARKENLFKGERAITSVMLRELSDSAHFQLRSVGPNTSL